MNRTRGQQGGQGGRKTGQGGGSQGGQGGKKPGQGQQGGAGRQNERPEGKSSERNSEETEA